MKQNLVLIFLTVFFLSGAAGLSLADDTAVSPGPELNKKLDKILSNQDRILQEIEELKSELNVVKIRVSQQ